jgi:hypothetical protein
MEKTFKLFLVEEQPYLTTDENVVIGDKVIVTVGDLYPSVITCQNEEQINLFQKSKLSMTKRYKVIMSPEQINLEKNIIEILSLSDKPLNVSYENGEINIINED